jgi:broad specificity phosphatase PhoE
MSERVNIKTDETTRDRLQELKRDGETWDGLLNRAADALEDLERQGGQAGVPVCASCGTLATAWTLIDGAVHCEDCADVEFPD